MALAWNVHFLQKQDIQAETPRALIILNHYLPDLIKGDLDSIRDDVRSFYQSLGVPVVHDADQDSTDLMKCVSAIEEKESGRLDVEYDIVILGGLAGRLDQTIHTLSYLHKLRKTRKRVFVVTDDNVGWVLDAVRFHAFFVEPPPNLTIHQG
ncbi:hypothetical protein C0995_004738 [Termitomyces sp. Mi166|nr:hypothetical protein C0995_004738 [Termitomyces sp. Mi166\